jgi:hypothetical protein
MLLMASWAFAEDKKDDEKKEKEKKEQEKKEGEKKKKEAEEERKKEEEKKKREDSQKTQGKTQTLYDQVSLARNGTVLLSDGRLKTSSPWVNFLTAGMWVRAQGSWDKDTFLAQTLEITDPTTFSYYRGPGAPLGLGNAWIEVWFTTDALGALQRMAYQVVNPASEVLLLAKAANGQLLVLPVGLPPVSNPPQGWVMVKGEVQGDSIRWKSIGPFNDGW